MEKKRILLLVLILAIAFLVLSPILAFFLNKITLLDNSVVPITISEDSNTELQRAYAFPVSLNHGQKTVIEFSLNYANITATIKIMGKGEYDRQHALNPSPTGITGRSFLYSLFAYGQSPSSSTSSASSRSITNDGHWYMEFAGDTNGDYLISRPGDYVIIVYGVNNGPVDTNVYFNLSVRVDGPGPFIQSLFLIIGIFLLVLWVALLAYGYLKILRRGI